MREPWCKHCGSRNHSAFDCSKQDQTYQPTAEELAANAPPPPPPPKEPEPVFDPPRFNGCPPICNHANLPAYKTDREAKADMPEGFHLKQLWLCKVCQHWHRLCNPRGPSGSSSDGERDNELPVGFVPFMRKEMRDKMQRVHGWTGDGYDLPQRPPEEEGAETEEPAPKKMLATKPPAQQNAKRVGELF